MGLGNGLTCFFNQSSSHLNIAKMFSDYPRLHPIAIRLRCILFERFYMRIIVAYFLRFKWILTIPGLDILPSESIQKTLSQDLFEEWKGMLSA